MTDLAWQHLPLRPPAKDVGLPPASQNQRRLSPRERPLDTPHITLQTSCGPFSKEFLEKLPEVEKAMREIGLDPSAFVIAKDRAQTAALTIAWRPTGHPIEYTVFVDGKSFTVTKSSDTKFLAYFYELCMKPDDNDAAPPGLLESAAKKTQSMFARIVNWLNKPAISP
jgi:hypothetical protein